MWVCVCSECNSPFLDVNRGGKRSQISQRTDCCDQMATGLQVNTIHGTPLLEALLTSDGTGQIRSGRLWAGRFSGEGLTPSQEAVGFEPHVSSDCIQTGFRHY